MTSPRAMPGVVLTTTAPAIVYGKPVSPAHWAHSDSSTTALQGTAHIHAIKDPDTYVDRSGIHNPPPPAAGGLWTARWSVRSLPDPANYAGGFYWLGAPSSQDGTQNITAAAHQWAPEATSPSAPSWHSFFPFKPSVTSVNHYLQGGGLVHHPRGVNFNSHFIEHMWLDWGSARHQPFTWVIAATVASWSPAHPTNYLLDSGRNPDAVGLPRLTADQVDTPRTIKDGLAYRNLMAISQNRITATAGLSTTTSATIRSHTDSSLRPRMYIGIFNGTSSYIGAYSPGVRHLQKGRLNNTSSQAHRFYVMGRANGHISQNLASHLLVFEIRYWNKALTVDNLAHQYAQLSSTWQFDKYRGLAN